jgi:hypothetical protein
MRRANVAVLIVIFIMLIIFFLIIIFILILLGLGRSHCLVADFDTIVGRGQ